MISDKLLEAVKTIHDECNSHAVCNDDCPFYREITYKNETMCALRSNGFDRENPEDWSVERSCYENDD